MIAHSEIPGSFYWIVGVIIVMNLGTIGSVLFASFRGVWWLSKLDSRVDAAKDMAVRAHKRIDDSISNGGRHV